MSTITLSKRQIEKSKGIVVLPIEEYRRLTERTVPEYFLTGRKAKALDKLVEKGLRDYRSRKTMKASSLREALHVYGKGRKH